MPLSLLAALAMLSISACATPDVVPQVKAVKEMVPEPLLAPVDPPPLPPRDQWTPRAAYELLGGYAGALDTCNTRLGSIKAWGDRP